MPKNWANELVKWLGSARIQPLVSDALGPKAKGRTWSLYSKSWTHELSSGPDNLL